MKFNSLLGLGQFFHLAFEFPPFVLTVHDLQWQCLYLFVFQRPIILIIVLISLLHFIRYVIIINLNQRKAAFLRKKEGSDTSESVSPFVKFLKVIGHPVFTLAFILVVYIFFAFLFLIPFLADTRYCTPLNETINRYLYAAILGGGFGVSIFFIVLFDFWVNFGKFKKCKLLEFWKEDIFYLRFEIYFFGVFLCLGYFIIYAFISQFVKLNSFANGWITSIGFHLLFIFQNVFALILTIIFTIMKCVASRDEKKDLIERILDNPEGKKLFKVFLKNEFAIENYHCYEDIEKYKKEDDLIQRIALGNYIFKLYMNGASSTLEVNIPLNITKKVKDGLVECQQNLFDEPRKALIANLNDTFSRLRYTKEFVELDKKEKFSEQHQKQRAKTVLEQEEKKKKTTYGSSPSELGDTEIKLDKK